MNTSSSIKGIAVILALAAREHLDVDLVASFQQPVNEFFAAGCVDPDDDLLALKSELKNKEAD